MKNSKSLIAIIYSLSIVISLLIVSLAFNDAYKYKFKSTQTISVTGMAKKDFESDLVKWSGVFTQKGKNLEQASLSLATDREYVKKFLLAKGIKESEIRFDAVSINRDYEHKMDANGNGYAIFNGFILTQNVSIESKDLDKVDVVSREISDLISKGVELNSSSPNYFYSKLESLKLELISKATENAKQRAVNIANESNSKLGELVKGDMGVFQITGQNDNEDYSYGGIYNTTSRKKTASITIKLSFRSL